jgi:hypothetical protein
MFADVVILVACEVSEGCCMRGEMINKATVVASEAEDRADVFDGSGFGPILDSLNFGGIHGNGVLGDDVSEEFDGEFGKGTLVKASEVVVLAKDTEDDVEMLGVLSRIFGEDEDIVEEDDNKVVEVGAEDVIHGALKGSRALVRPKGMTLN